MECGRCHGLMVGYYIVDLLGSETGGRAWRCVSCGDILDPVILSNGQRRDRLTYIIKTSPRHSDLAAA